MRGITGISCSCQGHSLSRATLHCEFLWACFVEWTGQLSAAVSCPALPPSLSTLSNNLRDTAVATANVVDVCTNRATTAHNLLHQLHRWLMFLQINCKKTTSITESFTVFASLSFCYFPSLFQPNRSRQMPYLKALWFIYILPWKIIDTELH